MVLESNIFYIEETILQRLNMSKIYKIYCSQIFNKFKHFYNEIDMNKRFND